MRIKLAPTAPSALRFTGEIPHMPRILTKNICIARPPLQGRAPQILRRMLRPSTRVCSTSQMFNFLRRPPIHYPIFPNPPALQIARNPSAGNPPIPSENSHLFEKRRPEPHLPKLQTPQTKKFPLGGARIFARNNGIKAHGNFASPLPPLARQMRKNPNARIQIRRAINRFPKREFSALKNGKKNDKNGCIKRG